MIKSVQKISVTLIIAAAIFSFGVKSYAGGEGALAKATAEAVSKVAGEFIASLSTSEAKVAAATLNTYLGKSSLTETSFSSSFKTPEELEKAFKILRTNPKTKGYFIRAGMEKYSSTNLTASINQIKQSMTEYEQNSTTTSSTFSTQGNGNVAATTQKLNYEFSKTPMANNPVARAALNNILKVNAKVSTIGMTIVGPGACMTYDLGAWTNYGEYPKVMEQKYEIAKREKGANREEAKKCFTDLGAKGIFQFVSTTLNPGLAHTAENFTLIQNTALALATKCIKCEEGIINALRNIPNWETAEQSSTCPL